MVNLNNLNTEIQNESSMNIDEMETIEICKTINEQDKLVPYAVEKCLKEISIIIDNTVKGIQNGGRLIYVGAGTSGRLGVLDASECPPTYGVSYELVQGLIAGGKDALIKAKEGAEDSKDEGKQDLININLSKNDTVIGIAASGRTPYVIGALEYANDLGSYTASIACSKDSEIGKIADTKVECLVGPEVITGSTRMKSGTAQKLILNMISTGIMIKLGKVYKNLMVDVKCTNLKLIERAKQIIIKSTNCTYEEASTLLTKSNYDVKTAIIMKLAECSENEAKVVLINHDGNISKAIRSFKK